MEFIWGILGGGVGVAAVTGILKLLEIRMNNGIIRNKMRIDQNLNVIKEITEEVKHNSNNIDIIMSSGRVLLHEILKSRAREYLAEGSISFGDRGDIIDIYKVYHDKLGGNGNIGELVEKVKNLEII